MDIERINSYTDSRFRPEILRQHGAFLAEGSVPCEIEITGRETAAVRCPEPRFYAALIEEFRIYAEHIAYFYDIEGRLIQAFTPKEFFWLRPEEIQPSQFYVDEDKVRAISAFLHTPEDIVLPLIRYGGRYVSLDGHTRLYLAKENGFTQILGFLTETEDYIYRFVKEAQKRNIFTIHDVKPLSHEQYLTDWIQCCQRLLEQ